ncbi:hypothetical protein B0H14DRAFT_2750489, partial [Mycena olivaceomarginata]
MTTMVLDSGNANLCLSIDEGNQLAPCKVIRRKSACHVFHEIANLTRLHHRNIIELLGAEEDTHHIYVVTRNRLGESESKHIMSQILFGLHYLHCLNITHRGMSYRRASLTTHP